MIANHKYINQFLPVIISVICMILFVKVLGYFYEFSWLTNDDVLMSMIAHGYGLTFESSPNLVFSNVIWGHFVQALPSSNILPGYSLATLLCLIASGSTFIHALWKIGYSVFSITMIILLVMTGAVIHPQFTINAGLMMVASVVCLLLFDRSQKMSYIVFAMIWAFIAFLIRKEEMILVGLIAMPLLPIRTFLQKRNAQIAFSATLIMIGGAYLIDNQAYKISSWDRHQSFESVRNYFTDIKIGDTYDIGESTLKAHNMKFGDVYLLQYWFFVDPVITNIPLLKSLIEQANKKKYDFAWINVKKSLIAFFDIKLIGITVIALLMMIRIRSYRLYSSFLICALVLAFIGWIGRPGVIRVYIPLMSFFLIISFLLKTNTEKSRLPYFIESTFIIAIVFQLNHYTQESTAYKKFSGFRNAVTSYNGAPFYVWGGDFPYEKIYPVLNIPEEIFKVKILGMNTATFSPYSNISRLLDSENSFSEQIVSINGVLMFELPKFRERLLNFYCMEHKQGRSLQIENHIQQVGFKLNRYRCN